MHKQIGTAQSTNDKLLSITHGFTIVELLVVIVVIGVLATITVVSYAGITQKAAAVSLQSDLAGARSKLLMYNIDYGTYPTDVSKIDAQTICPLSPVVDSKYCFKSSQGSTFDYIGLSSSTFILNNTNSDQTYHITENLVPTEGRYVGPDLLTIGNQTWAKANLNVGTMVTGVTEQTNNSILEKYCYSNLESNCTTYGALYQWDEAMQYVTTEGAKGICPAGSHIPSDDDWKILEVQLGMSQAEADIWGFRGTDQGTKLKPGGTSGLNIPLAGNRAYDGSTYNLSTDAFLWSSSEGGGEVFDRIMDSDHTTVNRRTDYKVEGYSVRCLRD